MRDGSSQSPNSDEVLWVRELYVHPWYEYIRTKYGSGSVADELDKTKRKNYNFKS